MYSDFGVPKIKSATVSIVYPSICHEVMGPDAMILVFWMLSFKPTFSLSSFTFIKRRFSSSSLYFLLCSIISLHLWLLFSFPFFVFPLFPSRWLSLIPSVYYFSLISFVDLWECAMYLFCAHLVPFAWVPLPTTFFFDIINFENLSDTIFLLEQRQLIIISSPFALLMYSFSTFFVYILFCFLLFYICTFSVPREMEQFSI